MSKRKAPPSSSSSSFTTASASAAAVSSNRSNHGTTTTSKDPGRMIKSSSSSPPPIGAIINAGSSSILWRVGKLLGQGACGSVHELDALIQSSTTTTTTKTNNKWVIKLAAVPTTTTTTSDSQQQPNKKKKKKKKTLQERNADTIHLERMLLGNTLLSLQGNYVPNTPQYGDVQVPPPYGEFVLHHTPTASSSSSSSKTTTTTTPSSMTTTYTYLVMERMESSLSEWKASKSIIGPIAQQMLECLRQIHELRLVYVDVKMDNFMFTVQVPKQLPKLKTTTTTTTTTAVSLAKCLRIIDFGLVEHLYDTMTGRHREDTTTGSTTQTNMVGTPLYASIHVMEGHTPSRKDDLESLGYVLLDFLGGGLPWSTATSNQDILHYKKKQQQPLHNRMYTYMKDTSCNSHDAQILTQYMDLVQNLDYSEKPNYSQLSQILGNLQGIHERAVTSTARNTTTTSATNSTGSKKNVTTTIKTTRSTAAAAAAAATATTTLQNKNHEPTSSETKIHTTKKTTKRVTSKKEKPSSSSVSKQQEEIVLIEDDDDVVAMDWEPEEEEEVVVGVKSTNRQIPKINDAKRADSLKLQFIEGPAIGECIVVESTLTIGRGSSTDYPEKKTMTKNHYTVPDPTISLKQLKLTFQRTTYNSFSVRVANVGDDDTMKKTRCIVKGKPLTPGGYVQCFVGDTIQVGSSTLIVTK